MILLANAIQHPVGQGLFYSCRIHCPAHPEPIDFVYDCGTDSKRSYLESAIENYHCQISRKGLDFIILSHYDADHVNGLDQLLDDTFPVGRVFLPYLSPMQRLVIGLRHSNESLSYYDFLINPLEFLAERGVNRIVFVTGGDVDDPNVEPPFDGEPPPDGGKSDSSSNTGKVNLPMKTPSTRRGLLRKWSRSKIPKWFVSVIAGR